MAVRMDVIMLKGESTPSAELLHWRTGCFPVARQKRWVNKGSDAPSGHSAWRN